ncbi:MAG: Hint domain-containing protein [Rhodobacter sp.]|nr:Hint domain-containing protein [Rhodobacter sp.]
MPTVYDFIELTGIPSSGVILTPNGGGLVEVDEPLDFTVARPNQISLSDTVDVDGVTYGVSALYTATVKITYLDGNGNEVVVKEIIDIVHLKSATSTLTYLVPPDSAGDFPKIKEIEFGTVNVSSVGVPITGNIDSNDDVDLICFAAGTRIRTGRGEVRVEALRVGDRIKTKDNGFQPLRWIGRSRVPATGDGAPVRIMAGALGNTRDLRVSPQHRLLISDWRAELLFGEAEVLVRAKHLVNGDTIHRCPAARVTYYHLLFDEHELVFSEGIPSESLQPGEIGLETLAEDDLEELMALHLEDGSGMHAARLSLTAHETQVLWNSCAA